MAGDPLDQVAGLTSVKREGEGRQIRQKESHSVTQFQERFHQAIRSSSFYKQTNKKP